MPYIAKFASSWEENHHYSRSAKVGLALLVLVILAVSALFIQFAVWRLNPDERITFSSDVITVDKDTYQPGDSVVLTAVGTFCNDRVSTTITRRVSTERGFQELDNIGFYAPPVKTCIDNFQSSINLPDDLPPGRWQILLDTTYQANRVTQVTVSRATEFFTVVPPTTK